ncbi:hypothetical protein CC79DRAFT_1401997 [Sarocladium strictum]
MGGGTSWPDGHLTLRKATASDLAAIVQVVEASYPDDPSCDYKFPHRGKYPADFTLWLSREYAVYLESDKFAVMVMVTPEDVPVAVGVWDLSVYRDGPESETHPGSVSIELTIPQVPGIGHRRDANAAHIAAYTSTLVRSAKTHFAKYTTKQFHLWYLFTHPDFRRRGAGTRLCNWAQNQAPQDEPWALTVFGSPMGRALYAYLGYKLVATETVRVGEETEHVSFFAMEKVLDY